MKWLKYKHKFAYGEDTNFSYKFLGYIEDCFIEDTVYDLEKEYSYSDKYRGLTYEVVDENTIDKEKLKSQIETWKSNIAYYTNLIAKLEGENKT